MREREREREREGEGEGERETFYCYLTASLVGYLGNLYCRCYRVVLQLEIYAILNKFLELILLNNWKQCCVVS